MSFQISKLRADRVGPPPLPARQSLPQVKNHDRPSFAEHLHKACDETGCRTNFSMHAQVRIESRDIDLKPEMLHRIDRAIDSAADKGAEKALVMLDDLALIVGVKNRTVITVVDGQAMKENVFTSIDSAVIA